MKDLKFSISINAPQQKVFETIIGKETYQAWTGSVWPGSNFDGEWKMGSNIRFTGPNGGGTLATITAFEPYSHIAATHIAVLLEGGVEDRGSEMACGWIGSKEQYDLSDENGLTELIITMTTNPDWETMFNNDWPKALAKLKEISEG